MYLKYRKKRSVAERGHLGQTVFLLQAAGRSEAKLVAGQEFIPDRFESHEMINGLEKYKKRFCLQICIFWTSFC